MFRQGDNKIEEKIRKYERKLKKFRRKHQIGHRSSRSRSRSYRSRSITVEHSPPFIERSRSSSRSTHSRGGRHRSGTKNFEGQAEQNMDNGKYLHLLIGPHRTAFIVFNMVLFHASTCYSDTNISYWYVIPLIDIPFIYVRDTAWLSCSA